MDYIFTVHIIGHFQNLLHVIFDHRFLKSCVFLDLLPKFASRADFSDKIVPIFISEVLEKFDNVWVIKVFMNFHFLSQNLLLVRVKPILVNDFDGPLRPRTFVDAKPHICEGATADDLSDSVEISYVAFIFYNKVARLDNYFFDILDDFS